MFRGTQGGTRNNNTRNFGSRGVGSARFAQGDEHRLTVPAGWS